MNDIHQESHGNQSEYAQGEFAPVTSKGKSKGHTFILHKMDTGPTQSEDSKFLSILHIGFDPNLERLVNEQHQENNDKNRTCTI